MFKKVKKLDLSQWVVTKFYHYPSVASGTIGEYEDGFTKIAWQISPDGRFYYLDKYYGGITSDEKDIWLEGKIDMNCMFVEKLQIHIRED